MTSLIDTGKDGYDADREFDRRTEAALNGQPSEWGDPARLFKRDAGADLPFTSGDFRSIAPIMRRLRNFTVLELGCGYGRLAPAMSSCDCRRYLGIDRQPDRIAHASRHYGLPSVRFEVGDVLDYRPVERFDIVFTGCVLQHLVVPDKLRLVETMTACRSPGGVVIMREDQVRDEGRVECEMLYARPNHPKHMIPIPFEELAEAFRPLVLERLPKVGESAHRVYVAREGS